MSANRRLEIHHVSCNAPHSDENAIFDAYVALATATNIFIRHLYYLEGSVQRDSHISRFSVSQPILLFIAANRRLRIHLASSTAGISDLHTRCLISGYMVRLQAP